MVADILSNVLDERNAPAFEATAQVTIVKELHWFTQSVGDELLYNYLQE